jgi:hypothetical protein
VWHRSISRPIQRQICGCTSDRRVRRPGAVNSVKTEAYTPVWRIVTCAMRMAAPATRNCATRTRAAVLTRRSFTEGNTLATVWTQAFRSPLETWWVSPSLIWPRVSVLTMRNRCTSMGTATSRLRCGQHQGTTSPLPFEWMKTSAHSLQLLVRPLLP